LLFTRVYNKFIARPAGRGGDDDADAPTFLMGWNSTPIQAEKSLYDLAAWCRAHSTIEAHVSRTPSEQILAQLDGDQIPAGVKEEDWHTFREQFRAHVALYGHIIYDLDFSKPLPLDDPRPMIDLIKLYLRGEGGNPHERQASLEAKREEAVATTLARTKGLKRWGFTKSLRFAQKLSKLREDGLADIGLGYPALRRILRELGQRLVDAQAIESPDEIFWLRHEELAQAAIALDRGQGDSLASMSERIQERSAFARAAARVTPPPTLPPSRKVMGISMDEVLAADESSQTGDLLKGSGTSAGRVTAPACVLHGPEDFARMQPGCVLVAKITTPAWTPLFPMAAAVVTDIGGPLSHGSIVAREYRIPAVMGTGVATKRIQNGQTITVDGSAGTVALE
jgi:pyruvate,water dikinase